LSAVLTEREKCFFKDQELIPWPYSPGWSTSCWWGDLYKKSLQLSCFNSDQDEIWQEYSSQNYASSDRVRF